VSARLARLVLLSLLLSGAGLALVIWLGPPLRIDVLLRADPLWIGGALIGACGLWFTSAAIRIVVLCREQGARIPFVSALRVHALALFGTMITPGGSGGAPALAFALTRRGMPAAKSWSVAIGTFAIDTLFFAWTLPLALPALIASGALPASTAWLPLGAVAVALSAALATLLMFRIAWLQMLASRLFRGPLLRFRRRALRGVERFVKANDAFPTGRLGWHVRMQALTLVSWLGFFAVLPMVAAGFGVSASPLALVGFQLIVTAVSAVVPTPGASGFFEAAIGTFLLRLDRLAPASAIALTWRLLTFYLFFGVGLLLGGILVATTIDAAATGSDDNDVTA
jgi:uncharacterized protein (TIRG00374 family)